MDNKVNGTQNDTINGEVHQDVTTFEIIDLSLAAVIAIVCMCGNALTVTAVWRYPELNTPSNKVIGSLALADFLVGCIWLSFDFMDYLLDSSCTPTYLFLKLSFTDFPVGLSVIHILLVAVDRYIFIVHPLRYELIWNDVLVTRLLCGLWSCISILALSHFIWMASPNYDFDSCDLSTQSGLKIERIFLQGVGYILEGGLVMFLYLRMMCIARSQRHRVCQIIYVVPRGQEYMADGNHQPPMKKKKRKASRMFSYVLAAFFISWTPHLLLRVTGFLFNVSRGMETARIYTHKLGFANSAINVFIYARNSRDFRRAYSFVLKCEH